MKKSIFIAILIFTFSTASAQKDSLYSIRRWAYQLQNIDINAIARDTSFQLAVIDYSADATDVRKFSVADIKKIKNSGKKVLAFISIGEAENFRSYWQTSWNTNPPIWMGEENLKKNGRFYVKYWTPEWKTIVMAYIDKIIQQGFDGVYLDGINSYYYWMYEYFAPEPADSLMMQLVVDINLHAQRTLGQKPFYIIPQNGEDIINSMNISYEFMNSYFLAISGVGVEDVFYSGEADENNAYTYDSYRVTELDFYQTSGIPVFSMEYLTDSQKIDNYLTIADQLNYVPYFCTRRLNKLCTENYSYVKETNGSKSNSVIITPSPAVNKINLKFENEDIKCSAFTLYDTRGKLIQYYQSPVPSENSNQSFELTLPDLPNGLYLIHCDCDKQVMVKRFLINK